MFEKFRPGMNPEEYGVWPRSIHSLGAVSAWMPKEEEVLVVLRNDQTSCLPLNHETALFLRGHFPFTAPRRVLGGERTVGVGDRLGVSCPGHLRVFEEYDALPILAQQSIRELNLTGRQYDDVLDCVTFAVFREGFTRGFGADGDHLKTPEEIEYALGCGFTMLTLDCSEKIRNDAARMTDGEVAAACAADPELEALYVGRTVDVGEGISLTFDLPAFRRTRLIYGEAIDYMVEIYQKYIQPSGKVDFEVSIDETESVTTPLQHYFVANELTRRGVKFETLAPRFIGEFQKGVDYIGELSAFEADFSVHCALARHFGYKISVHSGSDKFSVFPVIGKETGGRFHLKTAGTSWLEAMKLAAMKDPALYRAVHKFALGAFAEAKNYYHVTTDLTKIPDVEALADDALPGLFEQNDARQLIHITYGLILGAKDENGAPLFKDRLYTLWKTYAEDYAVLLQRHIGRHLETLGCPKR